MLDHISETRPGMAKAMTPPAAEELLNVIMLDDFVARRKALDAWTRRWVVVLEVNMAGIDRADTKVAQAMGVGACLAQDEVPAVAWGVRPRMHVLLQKPREL